jgi:hypothetical protein
MMRRRDFIVVLGAVTFRSARAQQRVTQVVGYLTAAGALLGSIPVALIYAFFVEHYVANRSLGVQKQSGLLWCVGRQVGPQRSR